LTECQYQYDLSCTREAEFLVEYNEKEGVPLKDGETSTWLVCKQCKEVMLETFHEYNIAHRVFKIGEDKEVVVFS
jgi:hypothetical protein